MPELPEVEVVKQSLNRKIKGKTIQKVLIKNRNLRLKIPSNFEKLITKKKIKNVNRFSKYLILEFDDDTRCIIHLGMSGTIHILNKINQNNITNLSFYHSPLLPKKHNHIEIIFKNFKLIYNDPRRFGYFLFLKNQDEIKKKFDHFGPEPFSSLFNISYILKYFKNKEKNIKNFLLDQKFVSGIGNIYASEILFISRINPFKKAKNLNLAECNKIFYNSKKVLNKAIKKGGSSIKNFKNLSGDKGFFQKVFKVYQREDMPCLRTYCSGTINKKFISNRSTFFCSICQKK